MSGTGLTIPPRGKSPLGCPAYNIGRRLENSSHQMVRRGSSLGQPMGGHQTQSTSRSFSASRAHPLQKILYTSFTSVLIYRRRNPCPPRNTQRVLRSSRWHMDLGQ
ncbi:UNVERIFIED_CONTAM: hypothetical protein Slati_3092000 [Sesamum latifolium]|uniref:Uncharacterized protein n=1 Tax=Sesamum latifolium TaxID=2727402 RepID=A0AAW2UX79_9LAMI